MKLIKINYEHIHYCELKNGLKVIINQTHEQKSSAFFITKYGSLHANYYRDNNLIQHPKGIAHYLEHLMFKKPNNDVFNEFTKYGASANAYTSFNHTSYLFQAQEHFYENLKILYNMVTIPYFPKIHIEQENDIINQEINMYNEMHEWVAFREILNLLAINSEYQEDIAGTCDTIKKITSEHLNAIFQDFYYPKNQIMYIASSEAPKKIINFLNKLPNKNQKPNYKITMPKKVEPLKVKKSKLLKKFNLKKPYCTLAFKLNNLNYTNFVDANAQINLLLNLKFGELSAFFEKLKDQKLINGDLQFEIIYDEYLKAIIFNFYSEDFNKVKKMIIKEFKKPIEKSEFIAYKNGLIGRLVKANDNNDKIGKIIMNLTLYDIILSDYYKIINKITALKINQLNQNIKTNVSAELIIK